MHTNLSISHNYSTPFDCIYLKKNWRRKVGIFRSSFYSQQRVHTDEKEKRKKNEAGRLQLQKLLM